MEHRPHHARPAGRPQGASVGRRDSESDTGADGRHAEPGGGVPRIADREVARRVEVEPAGARTLLEPGTGRRWEVREVDARRVPAAQADRCLIFDAESVVRRLWHYPADWRRMPAEELLRLAAS